MIHAVQPPHNSSFIWRISSVRLGLRSIINYHERLLQDCAFATVTMAMKSASAS
jgi:hypothetical protein